MVNELPAALEAPLARYLDLLDRWNRAHALTALAPEARYEELILDSAQLLPWLDPLPAQARVADFGTGMGIPAVVLALARPDLRVAAVDASAKKVAFLRQVRLELGMTHLEPLHARLEDLPPLDAALGVAKAVGTLDQLLSWWGRHGRPGGRFLALKGPEWQREPVPQGWSATPHEYQLPNRGRRVVLELAPA